MSDCGHDCEHCSGKCEHADLRAQPHQLSDIGKVIAVVSGKGGVGKSLVTGLLAVSLTNQAKKCAILDADITGPSIPKMFGLSAGVDSNGYDMVAPATKTGIKVMSANLLLDGETDPVLWRGPLIAGMVKQFWTDVVWGQVDYMFVDCPPGTGDVPLTVFQSLKIDGIIVVTSPQDLVSMIVAKAVNMAKMMNIPILGLVENMSYIACPDCGKKISVFGDSKIEKVAEEYKLKVLGKLPIDPKMAQACDAGAVETLNQDYLQPALDTILDLN